MTKRKKRNNRNKHKKSKCYAITELSTRKINKHAQITTMLKNMHQTRKVNHDLINTKSQAKKTIVDHPNPNPSKSANEINWKDKLRTHFDEKQKKQNCHSPGEKTNDSLPNFPTTKEDKSLLLKVPVKANNRNVDSRKRAATSPVRTSSRKKTPTNHYSPSGLVNHASDADKIVAVADLLMIVIPMVVLAGTVLPAATLLLMIMIMMVVGIKKEATKK